MLKIANYVVLEIPNNALNNEELTKVFCVQMTRTLAGIQCTDYEDCSDVIAVTDGPDFTVTELTHITTLKNVFKVVETGTQKLVACPILIWPLVHMYFDGSFHLHNGIFAAGSLSHSVCRLEGARLAAVFSFLLIVWLQALILHAIHTLLEYGIKSLMGLAVEHRHTEKKVKGIC